MESKKLFNYHKRFGFPSTLVIPDILVELTYTRHALQRREREKYRNKIMVLPSVVRVNGNNVFEVHTSDNVNCTKVLIKIPYKEGTSSKIVLVLEIISENKAKVISFWINENRGEREKAGISPKTYDIPNQNQQYESCND